MPEHDFSSLYEKLGDMQATLRIVKHDTANASGKIDALALLVANQGHIKEDVIKLQAEVAELRVEKFRREGAIGLVSWISRNWPVAFIIATVAAIGAWFTGAGK